MDPIAGLYLSLAYIEVSVDRDKSGREEGEGPDRERGNISFRPYIPDSPSPGCSNPMFSPPAQIPTFASTPSSPNNHDSEQEPKMAQQSEEGQRTEEILHRLRAIELQGAQMLQVQFASKHWLQELVTAVKRLQTRPPAY